MPFTPKDWRDGPDTATPLDAIALEDMETRLAAYTDSRSALVSGIASSATDTPYSVLFDGTDETSKLQAWINDAAALGRIAYLPAGTVRYTTLTYPVVANGFAIRGAGRRISILDQISGTAAPLLAPASITATSVGVIIEDIGFTAFNNQTANTGGIILQAVAKSDLRHCRVSWTRNFHIKIVGGQSAQGDTMYNTLERNVLENPVTTTHYAVWLAPGSDVPAAPKGSHPDGTRIINNHFQSATNTTGHVGIKIDAPTTDAAGYLGADSVFIGFNNFQEVHRPVQLASQRSTVGFNRAECTTGTMDVVIDAGTTTGFPSIGNRFTDNNWITHGDPDSFTFTDNGFGTIRWNDIPKGSQESGATNSPRDTPAFEIVRDSTSFGEYYWRGRKKGDPFARIQAGSDGSLWMNLGASDPTVKGARMYPVDVGSGQAGFRIAAIMNFIGGTATSRVLTMFASGEGFDRVTFRANGSFERGLGTAVPDIVDAVGNGSPEGVVTGAPGSSYRRRDGGAGTSLYVKESGTGNTGWTVASSGYLNVKSYGAIGDGVADDAAAIQAAINAAATIGGQIFIPAGTYLIGTTITLPSLNGHGGTLRGAGSQASILKLKNAANVDILSTTGSYWRISDLGFDGNRTNNTLGNCIKLTFPRAWITDCYIANAAENGILDVGTNTQSAHAVFLESLYILNCVANGIYIKDQYSPDTQGASIWIGTCGGAGIKVESVSTIWNNIHTWGCTGSGMHFALSGHDAQILGLYTETNAGHGIRFEATGGHHLVGFKSWANTLHGIFVENPPNPTDIVISDGQLLNNGGYGIVGQNSQYVIVKGITSRDTQATKTQGYAVQTNGTSDRWILEDNKWLASEHRITSKSLVGNNNIYDRSRNIETVDTWRRTVTATGSIFSTDPPVIAVTTLAAAITLTLPGITAVPTGAEFTIKDEVGTAGTNNITISRAGTDTIDGAATKAITANYGSLRVYSNGTAWFTR